MELTEALERPNWSGRRRIDAERGVLVGSQCPSCGHRSWPSRSVCPVCGSSIAGECELSREGRLLAFTEVYVPRPGIDAPYVIGLIELSDGVRLHAHVRGLPADATVPRDVALVVGQRQEAGPAFWFDAGQAGDQDSGGGT